MKLGLHKPSPAMVVACISLFIGLGGTSFAAVTLARNSVLSKHIKNGQVKRADLGANAVSSAKVGDGSLLAQDFAAGQLPKGEKGDQGPQGVPGSAVAYAFVNSDGTVASSKAKNLSSSNVSRPITGVYCFAGLGFTPRNIIATPASAASRGDFALFAALMDDIPHGNCPSGTQAWVWGLLGNPAATTDTYFYVAFN